MQLSQQNAYNEHKSGKDEARFIGAYSVKIWGITKWCEVILKNLKVYRYNSCNLRPFQLQKLPLGYGAWTTKVADSGENGPADYQMIKNIQLLGIEPQEPIFLNPYQV